VSGENKASPFAGVYVAEKVVRRAGQGCSKVLRKVDPIFAGYFCRLVEPDLHDLANREV
jgi:hypothetical protein